LRLAIRKLKTHKSPRTDEIPAEMIQSEGGTVRSEILKLTYFKRDETELPHQSKEQIIVPIYKKSDRADCSNY